jgi:hypothetical protein
MQNECQSETQVKPSEKTNSYDISKMERLFVLAEEFSEKATLLTKKVKTNKRDKFKNIELAKKYFNRAIKNCRNILDRWEKVKILFINGLPLDILSEISIKRITGDLNMFEERVVLLESYCSEQLIELNKDINKDNQKN